MTYRLTPEQQRRGQLNGARRTRHGDAKLAVLHALRSGPKLLHELAGDTGRTGAVLAVTIGGMLNNRQVIVIGTAEQAGKDAHRRRDKRIFALPGTPMLRQISAAERKANVAPGWYRPGFWAELERDLREHQRLAELVRR